MTDSMKFGIALLISSPEPELLLRRPALLSIKLGLFVIFLTTIHALIHLERRKYDGLNSIVIPAGTAFWMLIGFVLVFFGITF